MEGNEAEPGVVEYVELASHPSGPYQASSDPAQTMEQVQVGQHVLSKESVGLSDHYLSLSVTVVGLGLAAAAAAAASLATHLPSLGWNFCILWLLWVGGVLGIVVGYAGPMVGAFALPRSIPVLQDLLFPLVLGISEFLFFGPFLGSFTADSDIGPALKIWFAATLIYGMCAYFIILRARFLFAKSRTGYGKNDIPTINSYITYMTASLSGPVVLIFLAILGESSWLIFDSKSVVTIFLSLIIAEYVVALWFHNIQARPWQAWLGGQREREAPPGMRRYTDWIRDRIEHEELDGHYFLPARGLRRLRSRFSQDHAGDAPGSARL